MENWTAPCYAHFLSPPNIVVDSHGVFKYQFVCQTCVIVLFFYYLSNFLFSLSRPSIILTRVRTEVSTSNLKNHANSCAPAKNTQTGAIKALWQGSMYTKAKVRMKLMFWIVRRHCPYVIIEDDELLEILLMLNSKVEILSARTLSCDIQEVFMLTKKNISDMLKVCSGKRSAVQRELIVCDAKMLSFVLDFVK